MTRSVFSARYRTLREHLIAARRQAGLTQTEVARRLDRPQSFVAKYEAGERRLDVVEFLDVAAALAADPLALLAAVAATPAAASASPSDEP